MNDFMDKKPSGRALVTNNAGTRTMKRMTAWADQMSVPLEAPMKPEDAPSPDMLAHRSIRIGLLLAAFLFGGVGLWMGFWPLATGAVAQGKIIVESNRKTIQHLEGGIVKDIMVTEGQEVKSGQVLLRLDATSAAARRDSTRNQYTSMRATEARLVAERDGLTSVAFPEDLLKAETADAEIAKTLDTQRRMFATRKTNLDEQISVLSQRTGQIGNEIAGLQQQVSSASTQLSLLNDEIKMVQTLVASGNAVKSRLLALQRNAAQIQGQRGEALANIARANQQINQTKTEIANKKTEFTNQVNTELKDVQVQSAALGEQLRSTQDIVTRIEIKSPLDGRVVGLKANTIGGVVQPGAVLMEIVPTGEKLVVEARVNPQDIDNIHVGLPATVRLSAYKQRRVRPVDGTIITVSADRFDDQYSGQSYYTARIEIPPSELADVNISDLTPGMPADVLIVTGSRTMLTYLLDPIRYGFGKAFREE